MVHFGKNHLYKFDQRSRGILTASTVRGKDTAAACHSSCGGRNPEGNDTQNGDFGIALADLVELNQKSDMISR